MKNSKTDLGYAEPLYPEGRVAKVRGLVATIFTTLSGLPLGYIAYVYFAQLSRIDVSGAQIIIILLVIPLVLLSAVAAVVSHMRYASGSIDILIFADVSIILQTVFAIFILFQKPGRHPGGF